MKTRQKIKWKQNSDDYKLGFQLPRKLFIQEKTKRRQVCENFKAPPDGEAFWEAAPSAREGDLF